MEFIYEYEERWFQKEQLNISKDFFEVLIKHEKKIIQENKKENLIKFIFVGILVYKNEILIILPKYAKELKSELEKLDCIKTIIRIFKRIPNKVIKNNKDALMISNNIVEDGISEIAIADFIIKDFRDNGYYVQNHKVKSRNGQGVINWTDTINTIKPIIGNGHPIYIDYITENIIINNNNLISNLHISLYNYLLVKYKDLLGYKGGLLSVEKAKKNLDRIGNNKYITAKLKKELDLSFDDREINLLKAMYNYFDSKNDSSSNKLQIFGTTSFELVWEYVCKYIFNDKYDEFRSDMPYPEWYDNDDRKYVSTKNPLIPDIFSVYKDKLFILDAKYYSISFSQGKIVGNPGSYDIVKQHIYETVFNHDDIKKKYKDDDALSYTDTISVLVYPKIMSNRFELFGYTKHPVFNYTNKIINNIYISPDYAYELFLNRLTIDNNIYEEINNYNVSKLDIKKVEESDLCKCT